MPRESDWTTIPWPDFDTVLLDMDGTLLDLCFDDTLWQEALPAALAEQRAMSLADAKNHVNELAKRAYGTLDWYCIDYWSQALGFDIRPTKQTLAHLIGFRKGALAFLKWLKHQNKQVILATNAHPDSISLKDARTDLGQWVQQIMHAHDAQAPKEDPQYWQWLHKKTQFIGQQTL